MNTPSGLIELEREFVGGNSNNSSSFERRLESYAFFADIPSIASVVAFTAATDAADSSDIAGIEADFTKVNPQASGSVSKAQS